MLKATAVFLTSCVLLSLSTSSVATSSLRLGEENFGNKKLSEANYKRWPGLAKLVNTEQRVYQQWVNGNEFCCYQGDMAALNALLKKYAEMKCQKHELVLLPGPGIAKSFRGKEVPYDLRINFIQGIAGQMNTWDDASARIWKAWPVATIHLNDSIDLSRLVIPESVTLLQMKDLEQDALAGLASKNARVRANSCRVLASVNPYDEKNMLKLAELVKDEMFVAASALSALAVYQGKVKANQSVYKLIQSYTNSPESSLKQYSTRTLNTIESAALEPAKEAAFQAQLRAIETYCTNRE